MIASSSIALLYRRAHLTTFWVTAALCVFGNLVDLALLPDTSGLQLVFNLTNIAIVCGCIVGFLKFNRLLNFWYAIIGYSVIVNSWFFLIMQNSLFTDFSAFFLRETVIVALLLMSLAFVSHRLNSLILGFAYVLLAIIVTERSNNPFLNENILFLVILFSAYSVFVYLFTGLLKATISELNSQYVGVLNQNDELLNTNSRIEEQQQFIEEQKEELEVLLETVREKNSKLVEANQTKDKFLNIIAHDLRNPASAIEGFANILVNRSNTLDEEKQAKYTEIIYKASKQLITLLENLLQWARAQTGRISSNPVHFPIERIITNVTHSLESGLSQKQLLLKMNLESGLKCYADPMMIETVVRNLLSNAIKYSYRGGLLELTSRKMSNEVLVEVRDFGKGMNAIKIKRLLRNEHEISEQGTENEQGSGLGLLICKEFIRISHGRFWIESELEKGSNFGFSIPIDDPQSN